MKFIIGRTSIWNDSSPCEEAVKVQLKNNRSNRTEEYYIRHEIEINTIEELFEFSKKHGKLVFAAKASEELPYIEIYDDYRE